MLRVGVSYAQRVASDADFHGVSQRRAFFYVNESFGDEPHFGKTRLYVVAQGYGFYDAVALRLYTVERGDGIVAFHITP